MKQNFLFLNFTTVVNIFKITLFISILSVVVKNILKNIPKLPGLPVNQTGIVPNKEIAKGVFSVIASICVLAVTFGSFVKKIACSIIMVHDISKVQRK